MSPSLALLVCLLFIALLFYTDFRREGKGSIALWIPVLWVLIIGSRPISFWLSGVPIGSADVADGTSADRMAYFALIVAGLIVLRRRRVDWSQVFASNTWVCIYILYLGISVLWAGDPFVSSKRWIKDLGHVIMVLVVLTEDDPVAAARAFLARCAYLLVPLSVLVIKYYPGISRSYDMWTNQPTIVGICTDKNALGMTSFMCGVSLVWMLLELSEDPERSGDRVAGVRYLVLITMTAWLLRTSHSATALSCTVIGACVLLAMKSEVLRTRIVQTGIYGVGIVLLVGALVVSLDLGSLLVKGLGRDLTFTGRTAIWKAVLNEDINPIFGEGYYSFWSGERAKRLSEAYFYDLNEAHNGYIETYLNNGIIGVLLLIGMIISTVKGGQRDSLDGFGFGALRLAFVFAVIVYNITESTFDRLTPVWFVLLLVAIEYPRPWTAAEEAEESPDLAELGTAQS